MSLQAEKIVLLFSMVEVFCSYVDLCAKYKTAIPKQTASLICETLNDVTLKWRCDRLLKKWAWYLFLESFLNMMLLQLNLELFSRHLKNILQT